MLPSERRDVLDHVGWRRNAFAIELGESRFEIERIPVDDGVDEQVQPGRPVELALEGSCRLAVNYENVESMISEA